MNGHKTRYVNGDYFYTNYDMNCVKKEIEHELLDDTVVFKGNYNDCLSFITSLKINADYELNI